MGSSFTPPPLSSLQPVATFTPPPLSTLQPEAPPSTAQTLTDVAGGYARGIGHQAKGMFDTLSSLVDPHMGQKIGDAAIDAQIEQWQRAKEEYSKGNYGAALTRGLGAAVPFLGPLINQSAEKLATGKPRDIGEGVADLTTPILLVRAAENAPEIADSIRDSVGQTVTAAKAAVKAGGKDVAVGAGKTAAGGAVAYGAHAVGAGPVVEYLGSKDLITSGLKQVGQGLKAGVQAGKSALAPEPTPAAPRVPIWNGPPGRPAMPLDLTPIPGKLPSGRVPGAPAVDTATGQVVQNVGGGQFRAPAPASAAPAAAPPATAAPEVTKIPAPESPGKAEFEAKARAPKVSALADTLHEGDISAEDAARLTPGDWQRLSRGLGINNPSPYTISKVLDELRSREAAAELAKTQEGVQGAADLRNRAEAARQATMMAPSPEMQAALRKPGALEAAQALVDELNGHPGKKAFKASRTK